MSAWTRIVPGVIALVGIVGSRAEADFIPGSMSTANMATGLPSWTSTARAMALSEAISANSPPPSSTPVAPSAPAAPPVVATTAPAPVPQASPPAQAAPMFATYAAATTAVASAAVTPAVASPYVYNAFVNMGAGPYPEASLITSGNAEPWYDSTAISSFFGGQAPNAQQQAAFTSTVMQRIEQTFGNSGVSIALTDNPNNLAAHTLSLVSNTYAQILPAAIGMTDVGSNGFSFIDQEAKAAGSLDQLEWIVAHNISHELMLTMGVGENYDTTGNYIDARNANLSMMTNPGATFSSGAATALNQAISSADSAGLTPNSSSGTAAQVLNLEAQVVPEPGSLVVWGLLALGVVLGVRAKG